MKKFNSVVVFMAIMGFLASYNQKNTEKGDVFSAYISLKNALVNDDAAKAKKQAGDVKREIAHVNAEKMPPGDFNQWQIQAAVLNSDLDKIQSTSDIKAQRAAFSALSDNMLKDIKKYGLSNKTAYHDYCPMYNDGKGGHWLSEEKEIKNPYFGSQMMECGEDSGAIAPGK
jgi:Cu(I)/Ag(I) efflux system membrane fusion protein